MAEENTHYSSESQIKAFLQHARNYLDDKCDCPWFETDSVKASDGIERKVLFTFDQGLLGCIVARSADYEKDIKTALKYGYIGNSTRGRNGILPLRRQDTRMLQRVKTYLEAAAHRLPKLEITPENIEGVKIVHHRPSGLRTIGIRDVTNNRILFIDQIAYKK